MTWLVPASAFSSLWVPLTWLLYFHVLTCPCPCDLQAVSAPHSVTFVLYSYLSLSLWSPVCECPLLGHFSFYTLTCLCLCGLQFVSVTWLCFFNVLTCPCLCVLQFVSAPCSVAFFPFSHLSLPFWSSESEFSSLDHPFSMSWLSLASMISRMLVSPTQLPSFHVLTYSCLYGFQEVSSHCLVTFFPCPDLSLPFWSPAGKCPLIGHFCFVYWLVPASVFSRESVSLTCLLFFHYLTCLCLCGL